jgi:IclR family acetate operon transcriptional repressor
MLFDPEAFRAEIAVARRRGYSIDDGESSPGVRCLAVAILGVGGAPLFALSLTGPSGRFTLERMESCVPEMLAVARELTTRFGGEAVPGSEAVA